jgi:tripartite-type tricarboxylate transporter receptor subunit TctC
VKVYGITSPKRVPSLPDVATLEEQGLKGANVGVWHGLYAPKGTPKPVLDKLVSSMQTALADADVQKRFSELGAVTYPKNMQTPAALEKHLKEEIAKWAPLIKKAGQYAD